MCLRFQFCTHQRVCILYFLKKSQIRCTLLYMPIWHYIMYKGTCKAIFSFVRELYRRHVFLQKAKLIYYIFLLLFRKYILNLVLIFHRRTSKNNFPKNLVGSNSEELHSAHILLNTLMGLPYRWMNCNRVPGPCMSTHGDSNPKLTSSTLRA